VEDAGGSAAERGGSGLDSKGIEVKGEEQKGGGGRRVWVGGEISIS